ncbi:MBL fold metallo-hydrolase [Candidatus Bathyarchaeota archaeon]|nr:MBL fold metallo-hydrolase [Candidatus Bathyarchaeota archaeon]
MRLTEKIYLVGGAGFGYSAKGDCNVFLVDCGETLALIDSGAGKGVSKIFENIDRMGLKNKRIEILFNTHCHYDHIGGNFDFKAKGCKIAAYRDEADEIEKLEELSLYSMAKTEGLEFKSVEVDIRLNDGEIIEVGDSQFEVIHTPGHTPGGMCLLFRKNGCKNLFSGDTASAQGKLGWINGPGCDIQEWKKSIKKLLKFEPDRLFPGHGVFVLSEATEHLRLLDFNMNMPWTVVIPG